MLAEMQCIFAQTQALFDHHRSTMEYFLLHGAAQCDDGRRQFAPPDDIDPLIAKRIELANDKCGIPGVEEQQRGS